MKYDICIKGGGPAGSLLAKLLAERGWKTILLEGSDFSRPRVGETLAAQVPALLKSCNLEKEFASIASKPSHGIYSAWTENEFVFKSHILNAVGHTLHVDRRDFDLMLFNAAHKAGVNTYKKARVQHVERRSNCWEITWQGDSGHQTGQADIFIDATGRKSAQRSKSLFVAEQFDQLVGIGITPLPFAAPPKGLALKTCEYGWWYLSPLSATTSVVLLMTDLDLAKKHGLLTYATWKQLFPEDEFFGLVKQQLGSKRTLQVKPAHSQIVKSIHVDGFMAVGDALCSFDPVTGSGVLRAMQTAQGLAQWLERNPDLTIQSIHPFLNQIEGLYSNYLGQCQRVYSLVELWGNSPFWLRRKELDVAA